MAQGTLQIKNENPETYVGKPALRVKCNGDWELGKITEIKYGNGEAIFATFKKNNENAVKRGLKTIISRLGSSSSSARIIPLIDFQKFVNSSMKSQQKFQKQNNKEVPCFYYEGNSYERIELDDLKIGDDVIWFPYKKIQVQTNGTLNIGIVKSIGQHVDIIGATKIKVLVEFDNYISGLQCRIKVTGTTAKYSSCVNPYELWKLEILTQLFDSQPADIKIPVPNMLTDSFARNLDSANSPPAVRPCVMTRRNSVPFHDHPIPLETTVIKDNIRGKIQGICTTDSGTVYLAATFEHEIPESEQYPHNLLCESQHRFCNKNLLIRLDQYSKCADAISVEQAELNYHQTQALKKEYDFKLSEDPNFKSNNVSIIDHDFKGLLETSIDSASHILKENDTELVEHSDGNFVRKNIEKIILSNNQAEFGIQGEQNSCYADSCLFAMFAFSTTFDSIFSKKHNTQHKAIRNELIKLTRDLRQDFFVPSKVIMQIRKSLVTYDAGFMNNFMDAEDFLLALFQDLELPNFIEFDNGAGDHIHQIVVPHSDGNVIIKEIKTLLEDSLWYWKVKLTKVPSPSLILKLPFCNGIPLYGSRFVVPNIKIELNSNMIQSTGVSIKSSLMDLMAIICLKSSHYVCFVRTGNDLTSPWVFFNSNPVTQKPKVELLQLLGEDLQKAEQLPTSLIQDFDNKTFAHPEFMKLISCFTYICMYESTNSEF